MNFSSRRRFLQNAALGTIGLSAIPTILDAVERKKEKVLNHNIVINKSDTILFQGDSITDAGRDKSDKNANSQHALGSGYAFLAAADILKSKPTLDLNIYNKGISGNKVFELIDRWQSDCIELKPNVLSILIGVNDFWHTLDFNYKGTVEIYENDFRNLLQISKAVLPNVQFVIGEPFAVLGCKAVNEKWFPEFDSYRMVSKKIADEFNAIYIPYHTIFAEASKVVPPTYWTGDGVHPSIAGAKLMSDAWVKAVFNE